MNLRQETGRSDLSHDLEPSTRRTHTQTGICERTDGPGAELRVAAERADREDLEVPRALRDRHEIKPDPDLSAAREAHVLLDVLEPAQLSRHDDTS